MSRLVLLSGGLESATALREAVRHGSTAALFVDYAQRAAARERTASRAQASAAGVELAEFDLSAVGETFRLGAERRYHVPLPHRNLVLAALALSYAARTGARTIVLGINREDTTAYPSASTRFVEQFAAIADNLEGVRIDTPLIKLSKRDVVLRGSELGVDFGRTYSCRLGHALHCGRCPQCLKRKAAFRDAGVADTVRHR
jgi:7-cyano-7-deazaguanine synthase